MGMTVNSYLIVGLHYSDLDINHLKKVAIEENSKSDGAFKDNFEKTEQCAQIHDKYQGDVDILAEEAWEWFRFKLLRENGVEEFSEGYDGEEECWWGIKVKPKLSFEELCSGGFQRELKEKADVFKKLLAAQPCLISVYDMR